MDRKTDWLKFLRPHRIVLSRQGNQKVIDETILMFKAMSLKS